MILFYTLLVLAGSYIAGKLILGELRKERRNYVVVEQKISPEPLPLAEASVENVALTVGIAAALQDGDELLPRIRKLEQLLAEKNSELVKLRSVLEAERRHQTEFEKIKSLLQWQIFDARKMNKDVKRELDILKSQGENSQNEAARLQTELNYKEQLLNQNESKLSELKNRLQHVMSVSPSKKDETSSQNNFDLGNISFEEFDWRKKLSE